MYLASKMYKDEKINIKCTNILKTLKLDKQHFAQTQVFVFLREKKNEKQQLII